MSDSIERVHESLHNNAIQPGVFPLQLLVLPFQLLDIKVITIPLLIPPGTTNRLHSALIELLISEISIIVGLVHLQLVELALEVLDLVVQTVDLGLGLLFY